MVIIQERDLDHVRPRLTGAFFLGFSAMRSLLSAAAVLLASIGLAASAGAATLDLTGAIGSAIANGNDGDVTYSGNAAFGDVRLIANPRGSDLTWSAGNGLGIDCRVRQLGCILDNPFQIDVPEVLTVQFEQSVFLTSVDIAQLHTANLFFLRIDETGSIMGDGFDIDFDSDNASGGILTVNVNRWVSEIHLVPDRGEVNDFSLARLRIDEFRLPPAPGGPIGNPTNPIPEPSSVLLMIVGAGIVATQLRRFVV